jgi:hypothetical protein
MIIIIKKDFNQGIRKLMKYENCEYEYENKYELINHVN